MTKKHFEAIARVLRHARQHNCGIDWVAAQLANEFYCFNARFDRDRFMQATEVTDE